MKSQAVAGNGIPGLDNVDDFDREAYLANYKAHQIGISPAKVTENYDEWVRKGTYEKVSNFGLLQDAIFLLFSTILEDIGLHDIGFCPCCCPSPPRSQRWLDRFT